MFTNNKSVCAQRQKTGDSASTAKGSTTTGVKITEPNLRNTNVTATQACPNFNEADYQAAQTLLGMRYSLPDSDSTISAPNSAVNSPPTSPSNGKISVQEAHCVEGVGHQELRRVSCVEE
jgi:hypothetical protein